MLVDFVMKNVLSNEAKTKEWVVMCKAFNIVKLGILKTKRALAQVKSKNTLKDATVSQMNDLISKNKTLKESLVTEKQKNRELNKLQEDLGEASDLNKSLEHEMKALQRRLGSKEYTEIVKANLGDIFHSMDGPTRDLFEQLSDHDLTDRETIKLVLGLLQNITPAAKIAFTKTFLP